MQKLLSRVLLIAAIPAGVSETVSAATIDVMNGLVAHWDMNETSGTTLHDTAGQADDATLTFTAGGALPTYGTGKFDGGVDFNRSVANKSFATIAKTTELDVSSAVTLS